MDDFAISKSGDKWVSTEDSGGIRHLQIYRRNLNRGLNQVALSRQFEIQPTIASSFFRKIKNQAKAYATFHS